ncbi:MAG: hypothetical protein JNK05_06555 [Myxococcales bacterium]|nr:hypothetical protein [Myxococcales bacterium]
MKRLGLSICVLVGCAASRSGAAPSSATRAAPSLREAVTTADAAPVAAHEIETPPVACLDNATTAPLLSCPRSAPDAAVAWNEPRWRALTAPPTARSVRTRGEPSFEARALSADEQELVALGVAFLCLERTSPERGSVVYRMARAFYDAQQYAAAAALYRVVVLGPGSERFDRDLREFAADLCMDSLYMLGSRAEPRRPSCFDVMREDLPQIRASLCASGSQPPEEFCDRAETIACQLEARTRGESNERCERRRR